MGAPHVYLSIEQLEHALERIANGDTIAAIAKDFGCSRWPLVDALTAAPDMRHRYARAREQQQEAHVDRAMMLAEAVAETPGGGDRVQAYRLLVDTIKWRAARFYPKQFGDRVDVTSGGEKLQPGVVALPAEAWGLAAPASPAPSNEPPATGNGG